MIICPNCKEEIEDNSHYCDQCGQKLAYCINCCRVGKGRRCTHCGGQMVSADELQAQHSAHKQPSYQDMSMPFASSGGYVSNRMEYPSAQPVTPSGIPMLTLYNPSLDIRITGVNGAVLGRRQGPYVQFFASNPYVSGVHAQLLYKPDSGWSIVDKHSSNGTKLNQREILPDTPMSLRSGDIVTLANVNLQVSIS